MNNFANILHEIVPYISPIVLALVALFESFSKFNKSKREDRCHQEHLKLESELNKSIKEIKDNQEKMSAKINENRKRELRSNLVNEYTDLIHGCSKTREQLGDIEDDYEEYTSIGGNSYVHDLHDLWLKSQKGEKIL